MTLKEKMLTILIASKVSEKSSLFLEKNNTIVFKVLKNATKFEIKESIKKIFSVQVKNVNTLIVKTKRKRNKGKLSKVHKWKKAYITLAPNQKIDFIK
ncbi:50S ribosomal protein L23 [Buchnera aphidicola (Kurisakia onigurumii)]|uniref:50S ribosomal protein L23 n=1 Tax=Buchnera aphidicola TaxID=9 RepID=UPI0031B71F10